MAADAIRPMACFRRHLQFRELPVQFSMDEYEHWSSLRETQASRFGRRFYGLIIPPDSTGRNRGHIDVETHPRGPSVNVQRRIVISERYMNR